MRASLWVSCQTNSGLIKVELLWCLPLTYLPSLEVVSFNFVNSTKRSVPNKDHIIVGLCAYKTSSWFLLYAPYLFFIHPIGHNKKTKWTNMSFISLILSGHPMMRSWILTKKCSRSSILELAYKACKSTKKSGVFSFYDGANNNELGYIAKQLRNLKKKVMKCSYLGRITILGWN